MTTMERESVAAICLLAALADGNKSDAEQERLRRTLVDLGDVDPRVFERVMTGRTSVEEEARRIGDPSVRSQAYELAVGICNCDGSAGDAEKEFLARLAAALAIPAATAAQQARDGEALGGATLAPAPAAATADPAAAAALDAARQADETILTYAALNAGLELLPQSLATIAVVPLQTKMVHKVGTLYGYKLDSGHIKEFIATVGLGLSSQWVESYARRALGSLAGRFLGRAGRDVTQKATGPAMTFATTYALGHAAKAYYAGGRRLSIDTLRQTFSQQLDAARDVYARREPEIRAQAGRLDPSNIMSILRGA